MSLTTNRMRQSVGAVSLATALLLLLSLLFAATSASAETTLVPGNPKCEDLGLTQLTKWDDIGSGFSVGDTQVQDGVTFTVEAVKEGGEITEISFVSDSWVSALIFKASNAANVTTYDPAVQSGSGVTVETHGASHIELCLGEAPTEDPTLVVATCVDGGIQITVDNPNDDEITVDVSIDHDTPDPAPQAAPTTTDHTGVTIPANDSFVTHVFAAEDSAWSVEVAFSDAPDVVVASDSGIQDCEDPVNAPAASIDVSCELGGATITLDNTGSDEDVTYTVTIDGVAQDVVVAAGGTDEIFTAIDEDADYAISVTAEGMDDVTAEGNFDCEQPTPVNAPAAAVEVSCDLGGATATLDNTDSDEAVTYTVTVGGVAQDVVVAPGETDELFTAIDEDATYAIGVAAAGLDDVTADGTFNCDEPEPAPEPEPTTDVDPDVKTPEPAPEPAPNPAPEAEVVPELAATGMDSTELLLLALLLTGMGFALLLIPAPSRERTY